MINTIFKVAGGITFWTKAPNLMRNWLQNLPLGQRVKQLEMYHRAIGNRINPIAARKGVIRLTGKAITEQLAKERRPRFREISFL